MAYKNNDKCLKIAFDDEPLFVLMGRDQTSPKVVVEWIKENIGRQPKEKLHEALDLAIEQHTRHFEILKRKFGAEDKPSYAFEAPPIVVMSPSDVKTVEDFMSPVVVNNDPDKTKPDEKGSSSDLKKAVDKAKENKPGDKPILQIPDNNEITFPQPLDNPDLEGEEPDFVACRTDRGYLCPPQCLKLKNNYCLRKERPEQYNKIREGSEDIEGPFPSSPINGPRNFDPQPNIQGPDEDFTYGKQ